MIVYGRRIIKAEMFAGIDAIGAGAVNGVAAKFLYHQESTNTAIHDVQGLQDCNWMLCYTYWLRY